MASPYQKARWKMINQDDSIPLKNSSGNLIVLGCNYHTTWQSNKKMRFVLDYVFNTKVRLITTTTNRVFETHIDDLIFITSEHNINKAKEYRKL